VACSSSQPEADARELDQSQVVLGSFLVPRGDCPKALQVVKEDLDQIALAVEPSVEPAPVVLLPWCQRDVERPRLSIDNGVDLR
jgi:hypothetical protein